MVTLLLSSLLVAPVARQTTRVGATPTTENRVLIAASPIATGAREQVWNARVVSTPLKDGRAIRRFETALKSSGAIVLFVEESILPETYYRAMRPVLKNLRDHWRPGQPFDLAASGNREADRWLSAQLSPSERARTSRFMLSTSKTLKIAGSGGKTVEIELDTPPRPKPEDYDTGPQKSSKVPSKASASEEKTPPPPEPPAPERHYYNRDAPSALDEFTIQSEAAAWLAKRWRDAQVDFDREFADLSDAMENERRKRERIPTPEEGTAFGDLPPATQAQLRMEFEHQWAQMGFPSAGAATDWLAGSRMGGTQTQWQATAGGTMSNGTRYNYVQVIPRP